MDSSARALNAALENSAMARLQEGVFGHKSAVNFLQEARMLIREPRTWTKDGLARNASGATCSASDPTAVRWSLEGALMAVQEYNSREWMRAMRLIRQAAGTNNLAQWNHRFWRTHASVLRVLERAMEEAI